MAYTYPTTQQVLTLQSGRRHTIKCPSGTHSDSTPSFTIYAGGDFYCFGCGLSGKNGIDFLINVLRVSVPESMQYLRDKNLLTKIE